MGCGEARGALLGCRHVVLYAVVLFGALGVVEAIQRAYQVASDAAELLLMRFMPYRNRARPPNSRQPDLQQFFHLRVSFLQRLAPCEPHSSAGRTLAARACLSREGV